MARPRALTQSVRNVVNLKDHLAGMDCAMGHAEGMAAASCFACGPWLPPIANRAPASLCHSCKGPAHARSTPPAAQPVRPSVPLSALLLRRAAPVIQECGCGEWPPGCSQAISGRRR